MKKFTTLCLALFLASAALFGFYQFRQKTVRDHSKPVFNIEEGPLTVSVHDGKEALLEGVAASDAKDGDVTDSIIVESVSPFTSDGRRIVRYAAYDNSGHVTHARRELLYSDYEPPRFMLSKPLTFPLNSLDPLEGLQVIDSIDGDITEKIQVLSPVDVNIGIAGKYAAQLHVSNSAGGFFNLPVTIEVYDPLIREELPAIELTEYIVYLEKGSPFNEKGYIKSVTVNGEEYNKDLVAIKSSVDTDVPGCYEVEYSIEDTEGGTGIGENRLYVVVTDSSEGVMNRSSSASADPAAAPEEGGAN